VKKVCLRCHREYFATGVNFCFDDGEPLHDAANAPEGRICPKCETRYDAGTARCVRDQVPLVQLGDLSYSRQRVCSDCGRVAGESVAEFCGHDGARILPRWEVGLVARTAVPGELPTSTAASERDSDTTRPERPKPARGSKPPAASTRPSVSAPRAARIMPAASAPARAPESPPGRAKPAPPKGDPLTQTGMSSRWFASADDPSAASVGDAAAKDVWSKSAVDGVSRDELGFLGPARVSRKLIAATVSAALLFGGAIIFWRMAQRRAAASATKSAPVSPRPSIGLSSAPSVPAPLAPAPAPVAQAAGSPSSPAGAPAPSVPAATAMAPATSATAATPAQPSAEPDDDDEPSRPAKRNTKRKAEVDPQAALAEALRKATSEPRRAPSAPAVTAPAVPPSTDDDAKPKRLSRAEANRMFVEAAAKYRAGDIDEALQRFRNIERQGPRDSELQGRVLLNLGHIAEGQGNCAAAKRYYERAMKLVKATSSLRASLESRLARAKESCP
jgi:hypothetical protein